MDGWSEDFPLTRQLCIDGLRSPLSLIPAKYQALLRQSTFRIPNYPSDPLKTLESISPFLIQCVSSLVYQLDWQFTSASSALGNSDAFGNERNAPGLSPLIASRIGGIYDLSGQRIRIPQQDASVVNLPFLSLDRWSPFGVKSPNSTLTYVINRCGLKLTLLTRISLLSALLCGLSASPLNTTSENQKLRPCLSFSMHRFYRETPRTLTQLNKLLCLTSYLAMAAHKLQADIQDLSGTDSPLFSIEIRGLATPFTAQRIHNSTNVLLEPYVMHSQSDANRQTPNATTSNGDFQASTTDDDGDTERQDQSPTNAIRRKFGLSQDADVLILDFANKNIGGAVLDTGAAQEEILFVVHPECILARLFCSQMAHLETVRLTKACQVCSYTGYTDTFAVLAALPFNSRRSDILAADATPFRTVSSRCTQQFTPSSCLREINKLLSGLLSVDDTEPSSLNSEDFFSSPKHILLTGNWGCGCFNGEVGLKFLLQWIATSLAGVSMAYDAYQEAAYRKVVEQQKLNIHHCTVGSLWGAIERDCC